MTYIPRRHILEEPVDEYGMPVGPVDPIQELAPPPAAPAPPPVSQVQQLAPPQAPAQPSQGLPPVRNPVDLMAGARQRAADVGQRHRLGSLLSALLTSRGDQGQIAQQGREEQARILQAGREDQAREDLAVGVARQKQEALAKQAELKAAAQAKSAKDAELTDPKSQASQALQASLRASPLGQHLDEETIARITPANLKTFAPVLQEAKEESKLGREDARFGLEKGRRIEEALEKQKALLPGALKKARAGATVVNAGKLDMAREMQKIRTEADVAKEGRAVERKQTQDIKNQAKEYGKLLATSGVAALDKNLKDLESAVQDATSGGRSLFSTTDLMLFKTGQVDAIRDPKTKRVARLYQELLNRKIKEQAGSAVSGNEFERVKAASGIGVFAGEQDLLDAIGNFRSVIDQSFIDAAAPYDQHALELYEQRLQGSRRTGAGGRVKPSASKSKKAPARTGKVLIEFQGRHRWVTPEQLQKGRAAGADIRVVSDG